MSHSINDKGQHQPNQIVQHPIETIRKRNPISGAVYQDAFVARSPITCGSAHLLHPNRMSAEERIAEIGQLLARGLVRLRARQSSLKFAYPGESSLDFLPEQSGGANTPSGDRRRE